MKQQSIMKNKAIKRRADKLVKHVPRKYWPTLVIVISLIITACAFLWSGLAWLVFVSVIPFYIYFDRFAPSRNLKQTLFDFYLGGVIFSYIVLFWIAQADVSRWVTIGGLYEFIIKIVALSLCSLVFAGGFLIIGLGMYRLRRKPLITFILLLPVLWALSEIIRSYLFAIFTYGPGASIEPNWNFGALGLAAINSPLAFASRLVGLYGLTVLVLVINGAIYLLIIKKTTLAAGLFVLAGGISLVGYVVLAPQPSVAPLHVAAIHIANPDSSLIDSGVLPANIGNFNVVVMPEYSDYFSNPQNISDAAIRFGSRSTLITSRIDTDVPKHNQLLVYDTAADKTKTYDKQFIIPSGETLPYTAIAYFKLTGHQGVISSFHDTQQVARGANPLPVVRADNVFIGPSVCSSIMNPFYARLFKHQGARLLTNSASLVFLAHAPTYHVQERYFLKYQAISSGLPLVHASRTGTTLIIDANGNIVARSHSKSKIEVVSASLRL